MGRIIRCAIYDRVSTDIQVQQGLSLDTQKELLTEYANTHGYEIVDYYIDEGLTARKKLQNRRDFMRLLKDIKADKIDLVLVTKLDRWFRNVKDYHNVQAVLEEHHCNWKTVLEDYDTSTADGQLKINIMLAVAQNESDRTSERIKVVFEHKKRNQEHLNGPIPFGYKNIEKHLQKDERTRPIVEDIFRYYFSCFSKRSTIFYTLNTYHQQSPSKYQIDRILTSEVYAGMRYGRSGYCEPYITPEQHALILNTCQAKIYPATKEPYLFSQMVKCPHCGCSLVGFKKRHKCKDGRITEYKRYKCEKKFDEAHTAPCITEHIIESYLLEHVCPELNRCIYEVEESEKKATKKKDNSIKIKAEMERLNILFQKGRIPMDYYDEQYTKLEKELTEEQAAIPIITVASFDPIKEKLSFGWQELYDQLDYTHRKAFWKSIIKEIQIDPNTHKICGFKFLICGCSNI